MNNPFFLSIIFLTSSFYTTACSNESLNETIKIARITTEIIEDVKNTSEIPSKNTMVSAKVIKILDGDTMEVLLNKTPIKIRLEHIDCPEKRGSQPFGNTAKQALSDLCFNKEINFDFNSKSDKYGRKIAVIYLKNGLNINKEMIKLGMAWHFKKYSKDQTYAQLEKEARSKKIGLWKDPNPTPPWEWRKSKK